MIYLDYAANNKTFKEVLDIYYNETLNDFANPNSSHKLGSELKEKIDKATEHIASYFNASKDEIIYTSGATESNNTVLFGLDLNAGDEIIVGEFEHSSIVAPSQVLMKKGITVSFVPIKENGLVDLEKLDSMISDKTKLVTISTVDSELGIRQPIEDIAKVCKKHNCLFHTDSSASFGKTKVDYSDVDLITIAPHKFGGLNGIGILVKRNNVSMRPLIYGGKSTTKYRAGTPNSGAIFALEKAIELASTKLDNEYSHIEEINAYFKDKLSNYDITLNSNEYSIKNTINFSVNNIDSSKLSSMLSDNDVYVSTKSACSSSESVSRVIYALTNDKDRASSSIRVSFSYDTTKEEIDKFFNIFDKCLGEINNGRI